jgi:hypothetical protein
MIHLIHSKKTKGSKSDVLIDDVAANTNSAFAVYGVEKLTKFENLTVGWRLPVADTEGQYVGHRFELLMTLDSLDKFIEAATWARAQAGQVTPPDEIGEIDVTASE